MAHLTYVKCQSKFRKCLYSKIYKFVQPDVILGTQFQSKSYIHIWKYFRNILAIKMCFIVLLHELDWHVHLSSNTVLPHNSSYLDPLDTSNIHQHASAAPLTQEQWGPRYFVARPSSSRPAITSPHSYVFVHSRTIADIVVLLWFVSNRPSRKHAYASMMGFGITSVLPMARVVETIWHSVAIAAETNSHFVVVTEPPVCFRPHSRRSQRAPKILGCCCIP